MPQKAWLNQFLPTWAWFALLAFGICVASVAGHALHPDAIQNVPATVSEQTPAIAPDNSHLPTPNPRARPTFDGEPCTYNCSGHQAGYDWARDHSIIDSEDCDRAGEHSNSPSFAAGCRAYVDDGRYEEKAMEAQDPPQF